MRWAPCSRVRVWAVTQIAAYFETGSLPEYHLRHLHRLLHDYLRVTHGDDVAKRFYNDSAFRRAILLECLHIVCSHFDVRSLNYYNRVLRAVLLIDDFVKRMEEAGGRGAYHWHAIGYSTRHRAQVDAALARAKASAQIELAQLGGGRALSESAQLKIVRQHEARELYRWLQTSEFDDPRSGLFSPMYSSLHPGGPAGKDATPSAPVVGRKGAVAVEKTIDEISGEVMYDVVGSGREGKALGWTIGDLFDESVRGLYSLSALATDFSNAVGRHKCFYHYCCLTGRCRFNFGVWDAELKMSTGKEISSEARIEGASSPRYQGPIDDPWFIMTMLVLAIGWGGNRNSQAIIDVCLEVLDKYLTSYGLKGKASNREMCNIWCDIAMNMDLSGSVASVVHKYMQTLIKITEEPKSFAVLMVANAAPLIRCTRSMNRMSAAAWQPLEALRVDGGDGVDGGGDGGGRSGRGRGGRGRGRGGAEPQPPFARFLLAAERVGTANGLTFMRYLASCERDQKCNCNKEHIPMLTGLRRQVAWPPTEGYAQSLLILHLPAFAGDALTPLELAHGRVRLRLRGLPPLPPDLAARPPQPPALPRVEAADGSLRGVPHGVPWTRGMLDDKFGYASYHDALLAWLEATPSAAATVWTTVPAFLWRTITAAQEQAARRAEKAKRKAEKAAKQNDKSKDVRGNIGDPNGGGGSSDPADSDDADLGLEAHEADAVTSHDLEGEAAALASQLRAGMGSQDAGAIPEGAPLPDGGPDYDWCADQLEVFNRCAAEAMAARGEPFTPLATFPSQQELGFLEILKQEQEEADLRGNRGAVVPPEVALRHASASQQMVIGLAAVRMLAHALDVSVEQLRLTLTGAAGSGKSFVSKALSRIAVRLAGNARAALNTAPTGAATMQNFQGRTNASCFRVPPAPSKRTGRQNDDPGEGMSRSRRDHLKTLCGDGELGTFWLYLLQNDEVFMADAAFLCYESDSLNEIAAIYGPEALDVLFGNVWK